MRPVNGIHDPLVLVHDFCNLFMDLIEIFQVRQLHLRGFFRLFMEVDPIGPLRMRIFGKGFFRGFLRKALKGFCYVSQLFGRAKYLNLKKSLRRFDV